MSQECGSQCPRFESHRGTNVILYIIYVIFYPTYLAQLVSSLLHIMVRIGGISDWVIFCWLKVGYFLFIQHWVNHAKSLIYPTVGWTHNRPHVG